MTVIRAHGSLFSDTTGGCLSDASYSAKSILPQWDESKSNIIDNGASSVSGLHEIFRGERLLHDWKLIRLFHNGARGLAPMPEPAGCSTILIKPGLGIFFGALHVNTHPAG